MTTKIIYFVVNGREETAEFGQDCSDTEVKELFRAAAEVGPEHILKLFSPDGRLLKISASLQPNHKNSPYTLQLASDTCVVVPAQLGAMETRLQQLEHRVMELSQSPELLQDLDREVEGFKRKLQSVEHLSWMGLFRDNTEKFIHKTGPRLMSVHGPLLSVHGPPLNVHGPLLSVHGPLMSVHEERQRVRTTFLNMSSLQVSEEVREHLKTPMFDNWQWEEPEMLVLLQTMFVDLDFVSEFQMETRVLQNFLLEVYSHYNNIPFHNFQHCFCVTQMMYGLIWLTDLRTKLGRTELLIMLTSALCHDLDHPGYNNVYQINAQTHLALRYNDISPLENHHCAVAFSIISKPDCNILKNLSCEQYKQIRAGMIKCILATDMARHNEILNKFRSIQPTFDFNNKEHKDVLMKIMVKVSDISNEARPMSVAEPWLDCLLQEFFNQSDTEKLRGLPVTPFMDRDKVSKPSSQTNFIKFVLLPLFTELTKLFPCLEHILEPVRRALDYYGELERNASNPHNSMQTKT
ncbi:high affinity cGMP-specific 3',5'-cyclic phosphodiesterase 9A-like isoform X2 [Eucyclogobius newberryi]|uniref:high affinity cGMP-specific 3',5'-cyclic phosphodiesterase 9A-like isoform X2 n=1 Tax=Eucyclogobius newberryi TaxID=166745 RepID=UPI003B5C500F